MAFSQTSIKSVYSIAIPDFPSVLIKDESGNPTGTHKDWLGSAIVAHYLELSAVRRTRPRLSMLSAGSAALAVQMQLLRNELPPLKTLVGMHISPDAIGLLQMAGCEIFSVDLDEKEFSSEEILRLTHNRDGYDVTALTDLSPMRECYDALVYEILSHAPDYCFIPFGSGHLYRATLSKLKMMGCSGCHLMGVTTSNPASKAAEKLYAAFRPFTTCIEREVEAYKDRKLCGAESNVYEIEETALDEAIAIADALEIRCEASSIAGLALLLQMRQKIPLDAKILVVNTGKAIWNEDLRGTSKIPQLRPCSRQFV